MTNACGQAALRRLFIFCHCGVSVTGTLFSPALALQSITDMKSASGDKEQKGQMLYTPTYYSSIGKVNV